MTEHSEYIPEAGAIQWEREVRGYNRQQVDEYVAWRNGQIRELESKLSQGLAEIERLRRELSEAREAGGRPPYEEVSERVGQILKLAAEEAKAEREKGKAEGAELRDTAAQETEKLRAEVKRETDQARAQAHDQAERMLAAAQEQSERSVAAAKTEAEGLVSTAQADAERTVAEATEHAEKTVATALAQAKQQLDDATARATAIHDGAERRLNLLISRHTETVRRLTEIRDVVTTLVSGEASRGSLEDEVNRALAAQPASGGTDGRHGGSHDQAQGGAHRAASRQAGSADGRRSSSQPGPLDAVPAQPYGQPGRQVAAALAGRATAVSQINARNTERSDPLPVDRHDEPRHQGRDRHSASLPVPSDGEVHSGDRHGAGEAKHAAESRGHSAETRSHSDDPIAMPTRSPGRTLDDAGASGRRGEN